MSFFILFLGASANPIAIKLKSLGLLIYTTVIILLGIWIPHYLPSINDYWLVDTCCTELTYSYSFIFQAFLNITIYSLFFTTIISPDLILLELTSLTIRVSPGLRKGYIEYPVKERVKKDGIIK